MISEIPIAALARVLRTRTKNLVSSKASAHARRRSLVFHYKVLTITIACVAGGMFYRGII